MKYLKEFHRVVAGNFPKEFVEHFMEKFPKKSAEDFSGDSNKEICGKILESISEGTPEINSGDFL